MTDLEMTKLCAMAMGLTVRVFGNNKPAHSIRVRNSSTGIVENYWPIADDVQAMALVKRFELDIVTRSLDGRRFVHGSDVEVFIKGGDLNGAIVECVAKMQSARSTTKSNPGTDATEPQDK